SKRGALGLLERLSAEPRFHGLAVIVCLERALTPREQLRLRRFVPAIVAKAIDAPDQLAAEVAMALHSKRPGSSPDPARELEPEASEVLRDKKVLLVDDDVRNLFALASLLEDRGMDVIFGETGQEALAALERHRDVDIVLIDADESSLSALSVVLEPLGQRLLTARSGEDALRALLHEDVAVILLDMRMPGLDGLETAAYINARSRTRHIPIIFLTAHSADVELVTHAYASGAVDYVVKPFDPDVLRSKVRVFVRL